jgi:hypothetical protein
VIIAAAAPELTLVVPLVVPVAAFPVPLILLAVPVAVLFTPELVEPPIVVLAAALAELTTAPAVIVTGSSPRPDVGSAVRVVVSEEVEPGASIVSEQIAAKEAEIVQPRSIVPEPPPSASTLYA